MEILEHSSTIYRKNVNYSLNLFEKLLYSNYLLRNKFRIIRAKNFIKSKFTYAYNSQILLRNNNGLSGNYQWLRLYELYQIIVENRINKVLELGSGGSTIFFQSLNLKRLDTFEESEKWIARTKEFLKKNQNSEIYLSKRKVIQIDSRWLSFYEEPKINEIYKKHNHSMIYIDGPTSRFLKNEDEKIMTINYDVKSIIDMANPPKLIVIDGRPETVAYLASTFIKKYDLTLRSSYRDWGKRKGKFYYHSIFSLK